LNTWLPWALVLVPAAISLGCTPYISRMAAKNGVVDAPGGRKIHKEIKPLLGGLSLYLACVVAIIIFIPVTSKLAAIILGSTIIVLLGLVDDIYNINPSLKLFGQILAAVVLVLLNHHHFQVLLDYLQKKLYLPHPVSLAFMVLWIVLMTNAFNLIDGMDGLAVGTAAIITIGMAVVAGIKGQFSLMAVMLVVLGACLGFLPYNFPPAKIFMGDTGSMLLGFLLGTLYLHLIATEPFSASLVLASAFIFAYPVIDTVFAIIRRLLSGQPIFQGDQGHIHHLLLRLGLPERRVIVILYLGTLLFSALGVLLLSVKVRAHFTLALGVVSFIGVALLIVWLEGVAGKRSGSTGIQG